MKYKNLWLRFYRRLIDDDLKWISFLGITWIVYSTLTLLRHTYGIIKYCLVCLTHMPFKVCEFLFYVTIGWLLPDPKLEIK